MSPVISGGITLIVAVLTLIHFGSTSLNDQSRACETTQVYRWSDGKCYMPQGE
ncbi:hypothetical protein [Leptolyngbya sp. NIES-2104]|uniref:hypothetical protein n=1 Tax=Leptolyngbya sp. NIES-2104 TaxID=1552121 RepID=UPI0006EC83A0|nr:hypothetical protein [Leptolyngbya sp. NIES-2104]GAP99159.1 hypothetical protein NIES2104_57180 [Leptolyngbya sp. NIES-2104]